MHLLLVFVAAFTVLISPQGTPAAPAPTPPPPAAPSTRPAAPATPPVAPATPPAATEPSRVFPASWAGRWVGAQELVKTGDATQKFQMEIIITPTSKPEVWGWTIIYDGSFGKQERIYQLTVKDMATGECELDELNSIVIPQRFLAGALRSNFLVSGNRVVVREEVYDLGGPNERMQVEMVTFPEAQATKTGGGNGAPEVSAWLPQSVQKGTLRRVKPSAE